MAVAHDAQTRWPVTDGTDITTGDRTFTHTPVGTARGVVVVVFNGGANSNPVTGVLYGGVAMTLSVSQGEATEAGWVGIYTLTSGVPSGAQTVTLQGATAAAKWAMCSTATAATSQTTVNDTSVATSASGANPQVTQNTTIETVTYGGVHSGAAAPVTTVLTGCTHQEDQDYGAKCAMAMRRTSADAAGSFAIGYTLAADDYAVAAVSLGEFEPKTTAALLGETPAETDWTGTGASKTTTVGGSNSDGVVHWQNGDEVYILAGTGAPNTTLGTPTHGGSNLGTIALESGFPIGGAGNCLGYLWKAVATGTGSSAITVPRSAGTDSFGAIVYVASGSDGIGNVATLISAAKTVSLTRSNDHSLVATAIFDFSAGSATLTWTPSGQTQREATNDPGQWTVGVADWGDQGNAGATSYGVSAGFDATGPLTKIALEILGTVAAAGSLPIFRRPDRGLVMRGRRG